MASTSTASGRQRAARGRRDRLRDLPASSRRGRRPAAVQPQGAAGEPAAHRGRRQRHRRPHPRARRLGPGGRAGHRDPVHAGPRDHAGLHRRPVRRRPRHHARGGPRPRRRPGQRQPARPGRAGHRPLGDRRLLRPRRLRAAQRRARVRSATASATSSCAGARRAFDEFKVVPPGTGIVPPGQHRVPRPRGDDARGDGGCRPTPTPWSAPTRTPRWSTAWACSAGASAASRPRRRCSASRCRCSSRGSSASS